VHISVALRSMSCTYDTCDDSAAVAESMCMQNCKLTTRAQRPCRGWYAFHAEGDLKLSQWKETISE